MKKDIAFQTGKLYFQIMQTTNNKRQINERKIMTPIEPSPKSENLKVGILDDPELESTAHAYTIIKSLGSGAVQIEDDRTGRRYSIPAKHLALVEELKAANPKVEFKRLKRDCEKNKNMDKADASYKAQGDKSRITQRDYIWDFEVWINGEHRCNLVSCNLRGGASAYSLEDLYGNDIKFKKDAVFPLFTRHQKDFEGMILNALFQKYIPTVQAQKDEQAELARSNAEWTKNHEKEVAAKKTVGEIIAHLKDWSDGGSSTVSFGSLVGEGTLAELLAKTEGWDK